MERKETEFNVPIEGDKEGGYDPDHSMKAREFYTKYWCETLSPKVECYNATVGNYRGETIISFGTMSGCFIRLLPDYSPGGYKMPKDHVKRLEKIRETDAGVFGKSEESYVECVKTQFTKLYKQSHSFANFMPLIYESPWCINLNCVKGNATNGLHGDGTVREAFHDFPDLFFNSIRAYYLEGHEHAPEEFNIRYNRVYLAKFGGEGCGIYGWRNFVERNYLQDYFEIEDKGSCEYARFIQLAPKAPTNEKMPYKGRNLNIDDKRDCLREIGTFLGNALKIIENRADRLAGKKRWTNS